MKDVLICQKRIIRSIAGLKRRESCKDSFEKLEILTVFGLYIFELCIYIFKNRQTFLENSQLHNFNTRIRNNIHVEFSNLLIKKNSPKIRGAELFNKLPKYIKATNTTNIFKKQLRSYLIGLTIYSLDEF